MQLDQILNSIYRLPEASRMLLEQDTAAKSYPKGHILLRAGVTESRIYFIRKGIVRAYADTGGQEVTFWFGQEGDTIISMRSYIEGLPGYEHIQLLEPCELCELDTSRLRKLFEEDIHIANWGRKFAEQELLRTESRLISRQFRTAAQRYRDLLQEHPALLQRVSLGHIASYLGITQVSLSRIRADIR